MTISGYTAYQRREFCKAIPCRVQLDLNQLPENSQAYQEIRETCKTGCIYTTYQFHHWLIQQGYEIVRKDD